MQSVNKAYLADIIFRTINENISEYRVSRKNRFYFEPFPTATDEEVIDFICSIPYFDERLKDFLLGNMREENIIISQAWEIEFIKKCGKWAKSAAWLRGDKPSGHERNNIGMNEQPSNLSLPY